MSNEFTCALCGDVFEKARTDEEATEEMEDNFPGFSEEDCAIICDDCYKAFMSWYSGQENV